MIKNIPKEKNRKAIHPLCYGAYNHRFWEQRVGGLGPNFEMVNEHAFS